MVVTKEALVCSPDQSRILKSKGVPQKTIFAWEQAKDGYGTLNLLDDNLGYGDAAFTTAEMIEIMPAMGWFKRLLFTIRTGYDPKRVADYMINTLQNGAVKSK